MGPITAARFGKNIIWRSNWPKGAFEETQKHQVESYPKVVQEIDTLISEIAGLISVLPPDKLLHRACWEMAYLHTKVAAGANVHSEEVTSVRMIDYVQSVIAAIPPVLDQRQDVTEEEWAALRGKIKELFVRVNLGYQLCRTAKNRAEDPNFDRNFEKFRFAAEIYWCNVRGKRYQVHEPAYLKDMFLPHSDVLQELFGISGEQFVDEITKIWHVLSFGIGDTFESFAEFQKDVMEAVDKKIAGLPPPAEPELRALMDEVVRENGWEERQNRISGLFEMDLFDLQKTTTLPRKLLDELTLSPGEETEFFAEGEFRGWPLRIWPIFKRPFIRLDGRYYCFDLYSLLDNLYRVMQRVIRRLKPDYEQTWNNIQQQVSEDLPFKYLGNLLPGAKVLRQVYYSGQTAAGTTEWCETDGLLIYDDHLFVIEARGGAFTYTPPATDFPAYVASLKNLVLKPATQGKRFVDYLRSADTVPLFDRDHRQLDELRKKDFRRITICPVTLDAFTEMAAQVQHLGKIGVDVGAEPVWAVSLDDLRVYADIFENPLLFLHYVEQRMQAFRSDVVQSDDELDHLGLYLKHNHYSTYAQEMHRESGARIKFIGYRANVDRFFGERMLDRGTPCPLKQITPVRILEIVEFLSQGSKPGRAEVAAYLLDLDAEGREAVSKNIDEELRRQPTTKRPKPFSMHGEVSLTVFCWTDAWARRRSALAVEHARTVSLVNEDPHRLLLQLSYTEAGILQDVDWHWVDLASIPLVELPELRANADGLRRERIANAKGLKGKIGKNEPCPCGSGKKYKKCCLGR
ncbi:SEC-C metal-binding domain-containing protein [Candidatus Binatus sp.]|uniref:SEC-C metal-binding domain-containing protein n=1 Tax=Candidatus Binatus sp. TaxID=2811406 RepID=UPI002F9283B5